MSERSKQLASRVQEEHERLEGLILEIREEIGRPVNSERFADWRLEFVWKIRDFQNELTKHFDLEEDGGFMADVMKRAPRFSPRVVILEAEHFEACRRLDDIISELKLLTKYDNTRWDEVSDDIMALFDLLERHEAAERDLILEVYFQDIGVGD